MSVILNGNEYELADFVGPDGRGYTNINPDTGLPFFPDSIFQDMLAEIDSALTSYDVSAFIAGTPSGLDVVFQFVAVRPVTFADNFAGSEAKSRVITSNDRTYIIQKNGVQVGTMIFTNAGGVDAALDTNAGSVTFIAGDILSILAPAAADGTLEDVSITFKG